MPILYIGLGTILGLLISILIAVLSLRNKRAERVMTKLEEKVERKRAEIIIPPSVESEQLLNSFEQE